MNGFHDKVQSKAFDGFAKLLKTRNARVGPLTDEATIDRKGRIVEPGSLREEFGLRQGVRVRLRREGKGIVVAKSMSPREFIDEMEGFIKKGSPVAQTDPLRLKRIWEMP